jgi:serine/threonine protein kinase
MIVARENRLYRAGMEGKATGELTGVIKTDRKVRVERFTDHIRKTYMNKRRLEKAWKVHVVLAYMELNIVPHVFFVELPSENRTGFIAMEDLQDKGQELDRFLDGRYDTLSGHERRLFVNSLVNFLLMLTRKKIVHKDLKACNIFVQNDGSFILLDAEDIRFKALDEETLKRMLIQLNTTIPRRIAFRDRIRFFIKLTSPMALNKKAIFKTVVKESMRREIVYEGIGGLMRESW